MFHNSDVKNARYTHKVFTSESNNLVLNVIEGERTEFTE